MIHTTASKFLLLNRQDITNKWKILVREEVPEAKDNTSAVIVIVIVNSLSALIDELHNHKLLTYEVHCLIDKAIDFVVSKAFDQFIFVQIEAVNKALKIAERSNRDLEQFAAITAHDLKSPLATISEYLTLIKTRRFLNQGRIFKICRYYGTNVRTAALSYR